MHNLGSCDIQSCQFVTSAIQKMVEMIVNECPLLFSLLRGD